MEVTVVALPEQVVTVNCPVLSSAMFLCGIGCFGVILLHCSVVEMQRN